MEAIQLSPTMPLVLWAVTLFLILILATDDSEWPMRFACTCILHVIVVGMLLYHLYSINTFLGLWEDWIGKVLIVNGAGAFLLLVVFSILWRIGRRRYSSSGIHGLITVVLLLAALVLGGVGVLPPMIKFVQVTGMTWLEAIGILLFSILGGCLTGLLIRRIEEPNNRRRRF